MDNDLKQGWGYCWKNWAWHYYGHGGYALCSYRKELNGYKPLFARPEDCSRFKDLNKICKNCKRIKRKSDINSKERQQVLL